MKELIRRESFQQLMIEGVPLLDVRSPAEFRKGSIPGAVNLPLLEDSEREAVGKKFKQMGQDTAIALGYKLVDEEVRALRLASWVTFLKDNPYAFLYCFQGGLRSQIAQQWLTDVGYPVQRISGGYKAMRRFLIDTVSLASHECEFLLIAGKTGSGKTHLLNQFQNQIDLEGIASHRGSAFGNRVESQPSQIDFENKLGIDLLKLPYSDYRRLIIEDESRAIGSLAIPVEFNNAMSKAPIAVIEQDMSFRVNVILNDYIIANYGEFKQLNSERAHEHFADYLFSSLGRIKKRLGDILYKEIFQDMHAAVEAHLDENNIELHKVWIEKLLQNYYDPMYDYQLNKKIKRIIFRGDGDEFLRWASRLEYSKNH